MSTKMFAISFLGAYLHLCNCAPVTNMAAFEVVPARQFYGYPIPQQPKIFWNSIGDLISGSGFFPIEVNVPDIISNIVSGASGIAGGTLQRIPIVNRITSAVQPRPLTNQYFMLVPMVKVDDQQDPFVPFNSMSNRFPVYP